MNCPNCDYAFDPSRGLQCPRCGESLDCSAVGCENCDACAGVFERVEKTIKSNY